MSCRRCFYITVDSSMAASQNEFPFIRKPILCRLWKNSRIFIYLIFYHREIVKLDHFMTVSLSYANTVLWCGRFTFQTQNDMGYFIIFNSLSTGTYFCDFFAFFCFIIHFQSEVNNAEESSHKANCHTSNAYMAYRTLCLAVCSKYLFSNIFIPIRASYYVFLLNFSR